MATFDLTFGALAGLQTQAGAYVGVNLFDLDFAEVKALYPALAGGDILTIGQIPKGALVHGVAMETLTASQAGASVVSLQDDTGTPVVILTGHAIDTAGTISGPAAGLTTMFGGGTATGLHNAFFPTTKKLNILLGATAPTTGKVRVTVDQAFVTGLGN